MTTAISWAAVSSKPQAERESLHDQHRLNHALAEALDWQIVADVTVPGESRSYHRLSEAVEHLEAYRTLQDLATNGNIDWLIVKSRDRLARTRRLNRHVSDFLHDHGIRVYSRAIPPANLEERGEAEVWGEAIEAGYSEAEILRLKQRREMGMQARVRDGKMPALPPWGFKRIVNERGEVQHVFADPRAEEAVRFAISRYHAGISLTRILKEARDLGLHTAQGRQWEAMTVRLLVFQPCYYGLVAWGKTRKIHKDGKRHTKYLPVDQWLIAEANWDAPFTPDDWEKTLAEWRRRRDEHPRRRGTRYPLSGILWCGHCDLPMGGSQSRPGSLWYRCSDYWHRKLDRQPGRKRHYISVVKLHRLVARELQTIGQDPDALSHDEASREPHHLQDQQRALMQQADELTRRRQRWMDAYEEGAIELADFSQRIARIDADQDALASRMERLQDEIASSRAREDWLTFVRDVLPSLPDALTSELTPSQCDKLRATLSRIFRRITLTDGKIDLDLKWS